MSDHPHPQDPMMTLLFQHNNFVGESEELEKEIMPTDRQLSFGPGDAGMLATSQNPVEQDLTIVRAVDASKYADTFPDWEERLLNSYVLCKVFSRQDKEITLGWVSRVKVIRCSDYRYRQMRKWCDEEFPSKVPDWMMESFRDYTDEMSDKTPDTIPHSVPCPHCGSRDIHLVVQRRLEFRGTVGVLHHEGRQVHVPAEDMETSSTHFSKLECQKCKATAELEDDEWYLPGLSN